MNYRHTSLIVFSLIVIGLCSSSLFASATAATDDFKSPLVNPAAVSFGNAAGLSFVGYYNDSEISKDFSLFLNGENFGFVYSRLNQDNLFTSTFSFSPFQNIYLGTGMNWIEKDWKNADISLSTLFRPHNALSFAFLTDDIRQSKPDLIFGLGLKPFHKSSGLLKSIILASDFNYNHSLSNEYEILKPNLHLQFEPLSGILLNTNYNLENESVGMDISFALNRFRFGSNNTAVKNNNSYDYNGGSYYFNINSKDFPSLLYHLNRSVFYQYDFKKPILDKVEETKFGPFVFTGDQLALLDVVEKINSLAADDRISGIILKNPEFNTSLANSKELLRAFHNFKESGKYIIAYADSYGNFQYAFLASIADEIHLNPNGSLGLSGVSISVPYLNKLFDKIGIDIVDLKSHEYKSAMNMFTEEFMGKEEREIYSYLVEDFYSELTTLILQGRKSKLSTSLDDIINNGPYLDAYEVLQLGLIDAVLYEDEFDEYIKNRFSRFHLAKKYPNDKISDNWSSPLAKKIALIYAQGDIVMGDGQPGKKIGSKTTAKQISKARKDNSVKGIILRVNSGGGSAYASDLISREIEKCRIDNKPVIVSMGGAAASGGYYISSYANKIIAETSTITGSIGVTGIIPNVSRLLDKLYVNYDTVKKGDSADFLSFHREIKEEEVKKLQVSIAQSYDQFINTIVNGRQMSYEAVHSVAQGKVWSGKRAYENKLVDELGGFETAIASMKEITGYKNIELVDYSHSFDNMPIKLNLNFKSMLLKHTPISQDNLEILKLYNELNLYQDEPIQYRSRPINISE